MSHPAPGLRRPSNAADATAWSSGPRQNLAVQVANALREQVRNGTLRRGTQLRGELEFARQLGVSRQTLREATRLLTLEGVLTIRHGVGTFVNEPRAHLSSPLNSMQSMSALIRANGRASGVRVLSMRRMPASAEVANALGLNPGEPVAEIQRVRLMDAEPLAVAHDYIPLREDAAWMLPLIRTFDGGSIYEFMSARLQVNLLSSEASFTAVAASKRHALLLKVKAAAPLLLVREVHLDQQQRRGLYSTVFHNSARMSFTLVRPGHAL